VGFERSSIISDVKPESCTFEQSFSTDGGKTWEEKAIAANAKNFAKFWLEPIELVEARGFGGSELRELYSIIEEHRDKFIIAWDEHFGQ
jgi:hypothetical protein